MEAIRELERDHAAIERMLERFTQAINEVERSGQLDSEPVERMLAFFEKEVDGHHQEKEERVLLRSLLRLAHDEELRVAQEAFREHHEERKLMALARSHVEGACYGEPNCVAALVRFAQSYLARQRRHAHWEERVLFPAAERALGPDEDLELIRGFRRVDDLWGSTVTEAVRQLEQWLDQRSSAVLT